MKIRNARRGFTLIELLVVVLIIGILAAVALPQYQMAVDKSRIVQLFTLVKYLKNQQELFYLEQGRYAEDCEELAAEMPSTSAAYSFWCLNGGGRRVYGKLRNSRVNVDLEVYLDRSGAGNKWICTAGNYSSQTVKERSVHLCSLLMPNTSPL